MLPTASSRARARAPSACARAPAAAAPVPAHLLVPRPPPSSPPPAPFRPHHSAAFSTKTTSPTTASLRCVRWAREEPLGRQGPPKGLAHHGPVTSPRPPNPRRSAPATAARQVIIGAYRSTAPLEGGELRQGVQVAVHPSFNPSDVQLGFDVALVLLQTDSTKFTAAMAPTTRAPGSCGGWACQAGAGLAGWGLATRCLPSALPAAGRRSRDAAPVIRVVRGCPPRCAVKPALPAPVNSGVTIIGWGERCRGLRARLLAWLLAGLLARRVGCPWCLHCTERLPGLPPALPPAYAGSLGIPDGSAQDIFPDNLQRADITMLALSTCAAEWPQGGPWDTNTNLWRVGEWEGARLAPGCCATATGQQWMHVCMYYTAHHRWPLTHAACNAPHPRLNCSAGTPANDYRTDACQGDSGGPLLVPGVPDTVVGIVRCAGGARCSGASSRRGSARARRPPSCPAHAWPRASPADPAAGRPPRTLPPRAAQLRRRLPGGDPGH